MKSSWDRERPFNETAGRIYFFATSIGRVRKKVFEARFFIVFNPVFMIPYDQSNWEKQGMDALGFRIFNVCE